MLTLSASTPRPRPRLRKGLLNLNHNLVLFFPRFLAGQESELDDVELATKSIASHRHAAQSHWTTPRLDLQVSPRQALQPTSTIIAINPSPKARAGHPLDIPSSQYIGITNLKRGSSSVESRANAPWPKMRHD
ncbi:hypothetical protein JAAARDRAFT_33152 [Jaapia argillacea MUCL 33604]|uniref:Uncharacterized protein n=1 Tax=Jaapia argillacea MUCL 33604 TaxID=933084 RepID=A0A067PXL9_9AGAM|nr:hypothetical protein JAAARDRAFT_33152 [Jaapia argillacea MUCL 33604]